MRRLARIVLGLVLALLALGMPGRARANDPALPGPDNPGPPNMPDELLDVGIQEHLQGQLPGDATFQDESGKVVRLGDYFDGQKPTLLILAYHSCPVLCGLVQNAALESMKQVAWTAGVQYQVITLSIDPRDTVGTAADKRAAMLGAYGRAEAKDGWHFLVGDDANIHKVTDAVGWQYKFDKRQGQFAHPSAVTLLTPNGKVARYLYGIEFDPQDLRLGLLEASEGRSISTVDRIVLYCYHYDPQDRKYTLMATRVMQLGGVLTVLVFGTFLSVLWLRERRKPKGDKPDGGRGSSPPDESNSKGEPSARIAPASQVGT